MCTGRRGDCTLLATHRPSEQPRVQNVCQRGSRTLACLATGKVLLAYPSSQLFALSATHLSCLHECNTDDPGQLLAVGSFFYYLYTCVDLPPCSSPPRSLKYREHMIVMSDSLRTIDGHEVLESQRQSLLRLQARL